MTKTSGYKLGRKNNWRRWQWNRIAEILSCARRDALVLYLPAEEDLDRIVALQHGFRDSNLIAVDSSEHVVKTLRSQNRLAIHGRIEDVLFSWPRDWPLSVVIADFCQGFDRSARNFLVALVHADWDMTVSVNLLRGRENDKEQREVVAIHRDQMEQWNLSESERQDNVHKHRGLMFFNCYFNSMCGWRGWLAGERYVEGEEIRCDADFRERIFGGLHKATTYKARYDGAVQKFDSVVFTSHAMGSVPDERPPEQREDHGKNGLATDVLKDMSGNIRAIRAVRTRMMRQRSTA